MAQYGQLFPAAAEMYSSLSRFRLLFVTRLDRRLSRDLSTEVRPDGQGSLEAAQSSLYTRQPTQPYSQ